MKRLKMTPIKFTKITKFIKDLEFLLLQKSTLNNMSMKFVRIFDNMDV